MPIRLSAPQRFLLSLVAMTVSLQVVCSPADEILGTGIINSPAEGRFNIRLTVSERFGSERYQEQVVGGIPFPRGMLKDVGGLYVVNAMQMQLKSRFRPLAWWPDGSVRWVLAEFQTDMPYPTIEEFFIREATRRREGMLA